MVHRVGHVLAEGDRVQIVAGNGREEPLALSGSAGLLGAMDGHLVDVVGRKGLGPIHVQEWRALEGPHGMQVWVGPVQRVGNQQIGIADRGSGEVVVVDRSTAIDLEQLIGHDVSVEGYVDGFSRVAVVYWRDLEPRAGR